MEEKRRRWGEKKWERNRYWCFFTYSEEEEEEEEVEAVEEEKEIMSLSLVK